MTISPGCLPGVVGAARNPPPPAGWVGKVTLCAETVRATRRESTASEIVRRIRLLLDVRLGNDIRCRLSVIGAFEADNRHPTTTHAHFSNPGVQPVQHRLRAPDVSGRRRAAGARA